MGSMNFFLVLRWFCLIAIQFWDMDLFKPRGSGLSCLEPRV